MFKCNLNVAERLADLVADVIAILCPSSLCPPQGMGSGSLRVRGCDEVILMSPRRGGDVEPATSQASESWEFWGQKEHEPQTRTRSPCDGLCSVLHTQLFKLIQPAWGL